jgi:hypothetical protein
MIAQRTVERLGTAIAELHSDYSEKDLAKILQYAYEHRALKDHPREVAENLEELAEKIRQLCQQQGLVAKLNLPKKKSNGS